VQFLIRITGALLIAGAALPAHAELGGRIETIQSDHLRMRAAAPVRRLAVSGSGYTAHEFTTEAGTVVREYADESGVIFAVSWQGPVKPNLQQLLGPHFLPFLQASDAARRPGTGPVSIDRDDLVVHSGGHPRAFSGHAYLKSLIPAGVTLDALQ
jgi:hypothetical protein